MTGRRFFFFFSTLTERPSQSLVKDLRHVITRTLDFGESIVISNTMDEIQFRDNDGRSSVCCPDFFRL